VSRDGLQSREGTGLKSSRDGTSSRSDRQSVHTPPAIHESAIHESAISGAGGTLMDGWPTKQRGFKDEHGLGITTPISGARTNSRGELPSRMHTRERQRSMAAIQEDIQGSPASRQGSPGFPDGFKEPIQASPPHQDAFPVDQSPWGSPIQLEPRKTDPTTPTVGFRDTGDVSPNKHSKVSPGRRDLSRTSMPKVFTPFRGPKSVSLS